MLHATLCVLKSQEVDVGVVIHGRAEPAEGNLFAVVLAYVPQSGGEDVDDERVLLTKHDGNEQGSTWKQV